MEYSSGRLKKITKMGIGSPKISINPFQLNELLIFIELDLMNASIAEIRNYISMKNGHEYKEVSQSASFKD